MTLAGDFRFAVADFPLRSALESTPGVRLELVRVTMAPGLLSPFFWASVDDFDGFHDALDGDSSVSDHVRLDTFRDEALYRVEWDVEAEPIASVLTDFEGSVLGTAATAAGWECRIRFPDRGALAAFRTGLDDADVSFETTRLVTDRSVPAASMYGLTEKQTEAIRRAWELGYYDTPHHTTLSEVAADLGLSQQAVSERLRRGHAALIRTTVAGVGPLGTDTADR